MSGFSLFCDMCGEYDDSLKKLLNKRYCVKCISKARSDRRKQLKGAPSQKQKKALEKKAKREEELDRKRIAELMSSGPRPLVLSEMPFRLKRNEQVYFLGGTTRRGQFSVALALTNQRLFIAKVEKQFREYTGKKSGLSITHGIKTISLSSVIAIEAPKANKVKTEWKTTLHLDKGKDLPVGFGKSREARYFYAVLAEMVDRLNDPIDESVFSPKRERISDEVKVSVWRRDGGSCVRCGSRENLEYDHIIPVSKGGSNTVRNIELLCESCNRTKSNRIM